jgi:hypothetical protein
MIMWDNWEPRENELQRAEALHAFGIEDNQSGTEDSTQTLTTNNHLGTPLPEIKPEGIFRFYFGNPNGINLRVSGGDLQEYLEKNEGIFSGHAGTGRDQLGYSQTSSQAEDICVSPLHVRT